MWRKKRKPDFFCLLINAACALALAAMIFLGVAEFMDTASEHKQEVSSER